MKYELRTTLGVILYAGETLESVARELHSALIDVLRDHTYFAVSDVEVGINLDDNEISVALEFDGINAGFAEDTATEILGAAVAKVQTASNASDESELTTEMTSLRPMYA